jgi:hypothetical protein
MSFCYAHESSELEKIISGVTLKDVVYKQSLQEKNGACLVSIKIINADKQNEEEYEFNISVHNEYKVMLNVTKHSLKVSCEDKGEKNLSRFLSRKPLEDIITKLI